MSSLVIVRIGEIFKFSSACDECILVSLVKS